MSFLVMRAPTPGSIVHARRQGNRPNYLHVTVTVTVIVDGCGIGDRIGEKSYMTSRSGTVIDFVPAGVGR